MSGLIARFIYCFPKSRIGQRKYNTEPIPEKVKAAYSNTIEMMLRNKFDNYDSNEKLLRFTAEASAEFSRYYDTAIEPVMLTDFADCTDWGEKYHGLILRICGILHCLKCLLESTPPDSKPVELLTLGQAADIAVLLSQKVTKAIVAIYYRFIALTKEVIFWLKISGWSK